MGEVTKIAWTDCTFNGWIGCEKISPACRDCYASVDTYARVSASRGLPLWGPGSSRHVTSDANWKKPLSWNRAAAKAGVRKRVFAHSLSDVFEDRPELVAPRERLYRLILDTPWLDWLLLTKRPENILPLSTFFGGRFPKNVRLGTTVESQKYAELRIPHLLAVEAGGHFVSCEPLLEPVALSDWLTGSTLLHCCMDVAGALRNRSFDGLCKDGRSLTRREGQAELQRILATGVRVVPMSDECDNFDDQRGCQGHKKRALDQVIVGGESAAKGRARPFDPEWARDLLRQCRKARVAFLLKQMGSNPVGLSLKHSKGEDPSEWTADLQVQEFPKEAA